MALNVALYSQLLPELAEHGDMNLYYDADADVLYITFEPGVEADDSELVNNVLTRYAGDRIIGYTILNASKQ